VKRDNRGKDLAGRYRALDDSMKKKPLGVNAVRPDVLMTFPYEGGGRSAEVEIDTEEFTALCPWTGLPDHGRLTVAYVPGRDLLELKSLKYYLLSYRSVGIAQEHAAARILNDLVKAVRPRSMSVTLDYNIRGGLHTVVTVSHPEK
jgi:7-cyano-7-deazaguanine reductase